MIITCGVCDKEFEMNKAVAVAYNPDKWELILICSEDCIKEYTDRFAKLLRIKIVKGGENEQES
ncbi:unnamed protein product [marine sediment metagenome]|uniref:TRASH domain-containing protein n=1 Tax=marine sediment metagenome TaxID=412755 RepID=X1T5Y0_9ZZZZ